jgi:hypothetical protein
MLTSFIYDQFLKYGKLAAIYCNKNKNKNEDNYVSLL